jgi:predicted nucleic acid-binding protein
MTGVVVDASVALKWFVPEPDEEIAERLLTSGSRLHAPRFLAIETLNAAWKNWRKRLIDDSVVRSVGERLPELVAGWHADEEICEDAANMALALNHPIFDCLYLALAQRLDLKVVTADKRMLSVAPNGLIVALADWKP